jgi:hypothetical protein
MTNPAHDAVDTFLREVRFGEYGVPDRKVPDCPQCEEDELWTTDHGHSREVSCYRCNFSKSVVASE